MDSIRAKQIIGASENIQVLYEGSPVWLENVRDNNTAEVTYIENSRREVVPVYKLIENNPL